MKASGVNVLPTMKISPTYCSGTFSGCLSWQLLVCGARKQQRVARLIARTDFGPLRALIGSMTVDLRVGGMLFLRDDFATPVTKIQDQCPAAIFPVDYP